MILKYSIIDKVPYLVAIIFVFVEVERGLLRNNDLTFSLINNEYIYTNLKHKNRKQSTQNTKIENNPRISPKHKNRKLKLIKRI